MAPSGNKDAESERIASTYRRYSSRRKRRAWAADNPGNRAIRAELRKRVIELASAELTGEGGILDVGCGGGYWLRELSTAGVSGSRLHGVDLIEDRIERARSSLPEADLRVADARRLPFPDASFRLVLMFTVLSSLPDQDAAREACEESLRVLEPNGRMLVYEPRIPNPLNRSNRLISAKLIDRAASRDTQISSISLTVFPPLARRLGRMTALLYPRLSTLPPLHTHRLITIRREA